MNKIQSNRWKIYNDKRKYELNNSMFKNKKMFIIINEKKWINKKKFLNIPIIIIIIIINNI